MSEKKCFVISPIGSEQSETRARTNKVYKHIISKADALKQYGIIRSDDIKRSGHITMQIIENIVECSIMIADLSDNNANVYYELSLRHALNKPAILIMINDQIDNIPFDLKDMRIISYDLLDLDSVDNARRDISKQIRSIEKHEASDSIISKIVKLEPVYDTYAPDDIRVILGTINIGSRFRYELIEPFFEKLEMNFDGRLKRLEKAFESLMEESQKRDYLKRIEVKSAFPAHSESHKILDRLFSDVEDIVPNLARAMNEKDEGKISLLLERWRENNSEFMEVAAKRFSELMCCSNLRE